MSKVAYTVTCRIGDPGKAERWLSWLTGGHIAEVIAGGAESARVVRLDGACAFEVRYIFPDRAAYDRYIADHAPRLRAEGLKLFPPEEGFSYGRTVGTVVF